MKVLIQIGIIFLICSFAELITAFLPFGFPGSVMSMILLFLLFFFKWLKPEFMRETTDFLLNNMALFFVPATVGIIKYYDSIKSVIVQIILICLVSTVIIFAVTSYTIRFVVWLENKLKKRGAENE